jgi:hypothetical protein
MPMETGRADERSLEGEAKRHRASGGLEGRSERPAELAGAAPSGYRRGISPRSSPNTNIISVRISARPRYESTTTTPSLGGLPRIHS